MSPFGSFCLGGFGEAAAEELAVLQRVISRENCAAGITEHFLHSLPLQALPENARPSHRPRFLFVLHEALTSPAGDRIRIAR